MASTFKEVAIDKSCTQSLSDVPKFFWYTFYTAPKAEKVACQQLISYNYETYLPVVKKLKYWKNRQKKWIDEVLFPGYVFVHTQKNELHNILKLPKIISYITCAGEPCIIREKEINAIKYMLQINFPFSIANEPISEGEKVKIIYGPLTGCEGVLVQQKGNSRLGIEISGVNQTIFLEIDKAYLQKLS